MTYLDEIERLVRSSGMSWTLCFRKHEGAWQCVHMPRQRLSEADYGMLCARLRSAPAQTLTKAEIQKNRLRAHAASRDGTA